MLVQLSYAIGVAEPLSIFVDSYGSVKEGLTDDDLTKIILKNFDLRPGVIVKELGLQAPIYAQTACYGHFGNPSVRLFVLSVVFFTNSARLQYPWEKPKALKL